MFSSALSFGYSLSYKDFYKRNSYCCYCMLLYLKVRDILSYLNFGFDEDLAHHLPVYES